MSALVVGSSSSSSSSSSLYGLYLAYGSNLPCASQSVTQSSLFCWRCPPEKRRRERRERGCVCECKRHSARMFAVPDQRCLEPSGRLQDLRVLLFLRRTHDILHLPTPPTPQHHFLFMKNDTIKSKGGERGRRGEVRVG